MSSSGTLTQQIAQHFREVHFGNNWTCVSLKEHLASVSRRQALQQVGDLNTIAKLAYHVYYYMQAQLRVLDGYPLESKDSLSWETPDFPDDTSWSDFLEASWTAVERMADLIGKMPEERLWETFVEEKYGNYYRNLQGVIEHCYYHLGQIVLIRKQLGQTVN